MNNLEFQQDVFDKVLNHMRVQGKLSLGVEDSCAYRGNNGLKCAIGALIPDKNYDKDIEGLHAGNSMVYSKLPYPLENCKDNKFLENIQKNMHDHIDPSNFKVNLEKNAEEFSKNYGLVYNALETEVTT